MAIAVRFERFGPAASTPDVLHLVLSFYAVRDLLQTRIGSSRNLPGLR